MKILKSIDKVLAAFGNIKAMERTHVDHHTENLISEISGEKIAKSEYGILFANFQNLAGYEFLNTEILSGSNIKTFNGSSLTFIKGKEEVIFFSDTKEIESDYSNISNRWLTKISFVINEDDKNMMLNKEFDEVIFKYKKKSLPMKKYD